MADEGGVVVADKPLEITSVLGPPRLATPRPDTSAITSYCRALDAWAALMTEAVKEQSAFVGTVKFGEAWQVARLAISKSCLLDRMLYGGEQPSKTPCPVHKGRWSGCHGPWPGWVSTGFNQFPSREVTTVPATPDPMCQQWWDEGCRCATHKSCSCTTGWNPDSACGCVS